MRVKKAFRLPTSTLRLSIAGGDGGAGGEVLIEVEESVSISSAPQQQAQQKGEEVTATGFPKLEKTKEKLLKEIKRVVAGPNGERKVITYSRKYFNEIWRLQRESE